MDLFDGPRGREQDTGGLAARELREQDTGGLAARELRENIDCMYHIMTENKGDYLYLEVGTPVSKEGSEVRGAKEVWDRLGIGVIEPTITSERPTKSSISEQSQMRMDGQPMTSERPTKLHISERSQMWTDGQTMTLEWPTKLRTSNKDQSWTDGQPPTLERPKEQLTDQGRAWMDDPLPAPDEDQSWMARLLRISDQGRVRNSTQECEVMALEPETPELDGQFQAVF